MTSPLRLITRAYAVALAVGLLTLWLVDGSVLYRSLMADIAATLVIFIYGRIYGNSSFYDAYWSVIPPLLALYWFMAAAADINNERALLVIGLVTLWGVRLTWNWASHWTGMDHEDWRYQPIRDKAGIFAPIADLVGIHLFPTFQVFLACLPVYVATHLSSSPLNWFDYVAATVTFGAIAIETLADIQLHRFIRNKQPGTFIKQGLWAHSRHPNYFGELGFWWGLALFGLAAMPSAWYWILPGALAMTAMFHFASIPMMDERSLASREGYQDHINNTNALIPWPKRRSNK